MDLHVASPLNYAKHSTLITTCVMQWNLIRYVMKWCEINWRLIMHSSKLGDLSFKSTWILCLSCLFNTALVTCTYHTLPTNLPPPPPILPQYILNTSTSLVYLLIVWFNWFLRILWVGKVIPFTIKYWLFQVTVCSFFPSPPPPPPALFCG